MGLPVGDAKSDGQSIRDTDMQSQEKMDAPVPEERVHGVLFCFVCILGRLHDAAPHYLGMSHA